MDTWALSAHLWFRTEGSCERCIETLPLCIVKSEFDTADYAAPEFQRRFPSGRVEAGSWFSLLQAVGMGKTPMWAALVIKVPLAILAIKVLPNFNRIMARRWSRYIFTILFFSYVS